MWEAYQAPSGENISSRSSAMRSAFVRALIPNIPPTEAELKQAFSLLRLDPDDLRCSYCDDSSTEWDHFFPVMKQGEPTGYLTRIQNLVPACSKCNQSKGNRNWQDWIRSSAPRSPHSRGVRKLDRKIKYLKAYEEWGATATVDFVEAFGHSAMQQHNAYLEEILGLMQKADAHSKKLRAQVLEELPLVIQEKKRSFWTRLWRWIFS